MRAGWQRTWAIVSIGAWLIACNTYDAGALKPSASVEAGSAGASAISSDRDDTPRDGAVRMARDAATPQFVGTAAGTQASGASATVTSTCAPNPDPFDESCPLICAEVCNGEDDDCDGSIDEQLDSSCVLEHASATCNRGDCLIVECKDGFRDCDHDPATGCEVPPDDPNNCGTCGNRCVLPHMIATCVDGACVPSGCENTFADCDDNPSDCETSTTSLDNCAGCGMHCTDADVPNATASCEQGVCGVGTCFADYGDCNAEPQDGCEQSLSTTDHCGACGQACDLVGSVDSCAAGVCVSDSCEPGYGDCDGDPENGCESLAQSANCGSCGQVCDASLANVADATCEDGQCAASCSAGFADCDGDVETGCETSVRSLARCGGCDTPCARPNAVMSCATGSCEFVSCYPGYGDCNGDIDLDGCETRLDGAAHCGSCDNDCSATSHPVCSGGRCSDVTCPDPNTADCDQNGLPCEVDLSSDTEHCGACDHACAFTSSTPHAALGCDGGRCEPQCEQGWADCNGDYRDGCETPLTTLNDCGQCGAGCAIANASATCTGGSCRVSQCAPDRADCNGDGTSCETRLGTTSNCGGCGQSCAFPNAFASCTGSAGNHSCTIGSCHQSYYKDCDGTDSNGCEVDVRSDGANCGQCGHDCAKDPHVAGAACGNGVCSYTCAPGYGDCNSSPGCETQLDTDGNCGGCGVSCTRANATASCSSGNCTLMACNPGFEDCDGNPDDGCEPLTTALDCGACGVACSVSNGSGACSNGECVVGSCSAGWDDCDGEVANGCERNVTAPEGGGLGPCLPDASCTRQSYAGHDYFFCATSRTWDDARAHCRQQLLGDLVNIGDADENAFVQAHVSSDVWLAASDSALPGTWRWTDDDTAFWVDGMATGYVGWASGEPGSGDVHCGDMDAGGLWHARPCADALAFVCEVRPDLCPDDASKTAPGACGCNVPDTDTDADGSADCVDGCADDPAKTEPGACGCGTPDSLPDGGTGC